MKKLIKCAGITTIALAAIGVAVRASVKVQELSLKQQRLNNDLKAFINTYYRYGHHIALKEDINRLEEDMEDILQEYKS